MVSTKYVKSLLELKGVKQIDLLKEWNLVTKEGKKDQSHLSRKLNQQDLVNQADLLVALSRVTNVPLNSIINEVTYDSETQSIIWSTNDPESVYGDNEQIPIMSYKSSVRGLVGPNESTDGKMSLPKALLKGGVHICRQSKGHAMGSTIKDGDFVIYRLVDEKDWPLLSDTYICLIVDIEGKQYECRIKNRITKHGFIVMTYDNLDKVKYPNQNINVENIAQIWLLEWGISARFPNPYGDINNRFEEIEEQSDVQSIKIERLYQEINELKARVK